MSIILEDILKGTPGITSVEGANLLENCIVMLHRQGHKPTTTLELAGISYIPIDIIWRDNCTLQMERTYADQQVNTERAAVCLSILLTLKLTDYTIIMRSRKGTGFDYYLGQKEIQTFEPQARLEISGIENETKTNTIEGRFRQKMEQTSPTDASGLPAYISIIEFSKPKALFNTK